MKKIMLFATVMLVAVSAMAREITSKIQSLPGEVWYGAYTAEAFNGTPLDQIVFQPYPAEYKQKDLRYDNNSNQAAPLLLSNKGRYVWSEEPFAFSLHEGNLQLVSDTEQIEAVVAGKTLRDAYLAAMHKHFPASGRTPAKELFTMPQYNTWIELNYHQNQKDVLRYCRDIIKNGFPVGVFMIDDQWTKYYGDLDFDREDFPDPKAMVDEMHSMGFKVMVWVSPFVSADSPEFRELRDKDGLITRAADGSPARIRWWNGYSACVDLAKPVGINWLRNKLKHLQTAYGIDGFKMDAVDFDFYSNKSPVFPNDDVNATPQEQCLLYTKLAEEFELSELRASWKGGNIPVSQRLQDKGPSWDDLQLIVPDMVSAGLIGYPFTCPDMIGGGLLTTFWSEDAEFDQEFIIRSAQSQVMMPMMQFSAAPWRILDNNHLEICREAAIQHARMGEEIYQMALQAARDGEPIVRHMEYMFPNEGFEACRDQYMLGEKYLVCPVIHKGDSRTVHLPKGTWTDEQGKRYKGGKSYTINAPLTRLPYFVKKK